LKVTLPAVPFDLPPKPREITAAAPAHSGGDVDVSLVEIDEATDPVLEVTDGEGVRWDKGDD
tara:strand:- start:230 stop:415 length:186 start_codon:yes stop_codon:yes gene_type:complete